MPIKEFTKQLKSDLDKGVKVLRATGTGDYEIPTAIINKWTNELNTENPFKSLKRNTNLKAKKGGKLREEFPIYVGKFADFVPSKVGDATGPTTTSPLDLKHGGSDPNSVIMNPEKYQTINKAWIEHEFEGMEDIHVLCTETDIEDDPSIVSEIPQDMAVKMNEREEDFIKETRNTIIDDKPVIRIADSSSTGRQAKAEDYLEALIMPIVKWRKLGPDFNVSLKVKSSRITGEIDSLVNIPKSDGSVITKTPTDNADFHIKKRWKTGTFFIDDELNQKLSWVTMLGNGVESSISKTAEGSYVYKGFTFKPLGEWAPGKIMVDKTVGNVRTKLSVTSEDATHELEDFQALFIADASVVSEMWITQSKLYKPSNAYEHVAGRTKIKGGSLALILAKVGAVVFTTAKGDTLSRKAIADNLDKTISDSRKATK